MIPAELLRRYSFFGHLNGDQRKALAAIGEEITLKDKEIVFEEAHPAEALYFLIDGCIELYYTIRDAYLSSDREEVLVCQINVGEPFGISTMIEPFILTSTARSCKTSHVLKFNAPALRKLLEQDPHLEVFLLRQMAAAAIDRLHATRTQLAAAWA
jgi:CRP-like cAMP-binding protein